MLNIYFAPHKKVFELIQVYFRSEKRCTRTLNRHRTASRDLTLTEISCPGFTVSDFKIFILFNRGPNTKR